jgi:hypothetical protein
MGLAQSSTGMLEQGTQVPSPAPDLILAGESRRDNSMNVKCANDKLSQWKGSENETTAAVPT